ncbi:transmembrane protein 129, E3 ubiquitin ligase, partial [Homo sapiens]
VFTPNEFHAAGLTVQNLLSGWLGSEDAAFVPFHLRRTAATLLCHSLLPLVTGPTPNVDYYFLPTGTCWCNSSPSPWLIWTFKLSSIWPAGP